MTISCKILTLMTGLMLLAITACGGGSGDSSGEGNGRLSLSVTDASTTRYRAIYITVQDIQVHLGGNESSPRSWQSVDMPTSPMTLDLLQLVNGVREDLGLANLASGRYTQMRLILGRTPDGSLNSLSQSHPHANYLIDQGNPANIQELKIPSGFNSGVKIVNGFQIQANQTTELVLDFDACRSVVKAGNSGNWHLKPTIRVAELHDFAIVQGSVTDGAQGIEGALVSVQTYDPDAVDPKDRVIIAASTVSDEFGDYSLFVAPGAYQLVAYKRGRQVSVSKITTTMGQVLDSGETDFVLGASTPGQVVGAISLMNAGSEQYVTLGFRQAIVIDTDSVQIEMDTINAMDGSAFNTNLPAGSYLLVASSFEYTTVELSATVDIGSTTQQDVTLAP